MNSDPRVGRLLVRWQKLRKQGCAPSVDELCADCPELHGEVSRQIQNLIALEDLLNHTGRPQDENAEDAAEGGTQLTAQAPQGDSPTDADDLDIVATVRRSGAAPAGGAQLDTDPPIPSSMRGYRLLERLGGGTFGVVYKALSSGGVEVAVKEIRYTVGDAQAQRELEALELIKGLRHPYLLALHDFWVENDRLYMAMNLADGTLAQLAAASGSKGLSPEEVLPLFEQAAQALDFLHQHHVLHRDVKPANILLLAGVAQVADLGLAKFNPDSVAVSQTLAGTQAYMAPEMFKNEFRAESDQYALALCYAEVRLGRQTCEGTNMAAVLHWHMFAKPDLNGLRPHEEKAVLRALSKDPTDRFRSCQEFVQALEEPPPPPLRHRVWTWQPIAFALLLAVPVLVLVLWWRLTPPPFTGAPPTQLTPPSQPDVWKPEENHFLRLDAAPPVLVGGKQYYEHIGRKVGDKEVHFVLIPDDKHPFYMMDDKVNNGQFKAAWDSDGFKSELLSWQTEYPGLKTEQWRKGGRRNTNEDVGSDDDELPVLRVNVVEAYCFAHCVGGDLPTTDQWDQAAGKGKQKEIYLKPDEPWLLHPNDDPPEIAVGRGTQGPLHVGKARRDESIYHCRDMAGDGIEWTGTLDTGKRFRHGLMLNLDDALVIMRSRSYVHDQPYHFEDGDRPDYRPCSWVDPMVGFRVVVEP